MSLTSLRGRHTVAIVDLAAIRSNTLALREIAGAAELVLAVKADAYGHGAVRVAETLDPLSPRYFAVATVDEALELRDAGVRTPTFVLSEPSTDAIGALIESSASVAVYNEAFVAALALEARRRNCRVDVHMKVDTGMHRVGSRPEDVGKIARAIRAEPHLNLVSFWTHLARADEPDSATTDEQIGVFDSAVERYSAQLGQVKLHLANSAGLLFHRDSVRDWVRVGIGIYGVSPRASDVTDVELVPALRLESRVCHVADHDPGEGISYGHHFRVEQQSVRMATIPIGYADGVPRSLGIAGGGVLIRGRLCPIRGVVTMDQLVVECGPSLESDVSVGDEVVLIGRQGDLEISAWDWATKTGTIAYEVLARIGVRVPRSYVG